LAHVFPNGGVACEAGVGFLGSLRKQATAYSLGWSEALRAQPQDPSINEAPARETGGSQTIPDAVACFAGSKPFSNFPGVALAKPRSTPGYIRSPAFAGYPLQFLKTPVFSESLHMSTLDDAKQKAATTYNAASDCFDHPANSFWERFGRRTVERLQLARGARVLDLCCGSGASAIPAAEIVGPGGSVVGVDLAENLLELARTKAKQRGLTNTEFRSGDMTNLAFEEGSFDAVVCVFGIFFVPDMEAALRELKRVLRTNGMLAITTLGTTTL